MVKSCLFFLLLFWFVGVSAGNVDTTGVYLNNIGIYASEKVHGFGLVDFGTSVKYKFKLLNTKEEALLIWHVSSSCGCTSPEWTEKAVKKGEKAIVKIRYDAFEEGEFEKSVFVYTNFSDKPEKLTITGVVVKPKSETKLLKVKSNFNTVAPAAE